MLSRVKQQPGGSCSRLFLGFILFKASYGILHSTRVSLGIHREVWTTFLHTALPALRAHQASAGSGWTQGEQNPQKTVTSLIHSSRQDSQRLNWEWARAPLWAWKLELA